MSEMEFKHFTRNTLGIDIINMGDSIFDSKYNLSETDTIYYIYCLLSNLRFKKMDLSNLLELDDITFNSIFKMCN
jgi:hypothetical protein